uniref:protein-disulfide reductase n=1 Tax=Elaeophora elaphi TaxID=1147741 RepID=A0A0R3S4P8_9BILA
MLLARIRRLNFGRCYAAGAEFLKEVPLVKRDGETVKAVDLKNKAIILYFSAGWCGHCRLFTPKLKVNENIEIVWVSRDREAKHQLDYYNKALPNVPYIPFGDRHISEFLQKYDVKTIPAARLVNSKGEVVDQEVRNKVQVW